MTETTPTPAKAKPKAVKVRIKRDYWPMDGQGRCRHGDVVMLPMAEALTCLNSGIAERADPITAEDLE